MMEQIWLVLILLLGICGGATLIDSDASHLQEAFHGDKRILVKFVAPWCSACHRLNPVFNTVATSIKEQNPNMELFSIDATKEMALSMQFDLQYYPLVVIIEDKKVYELKGEKTRERLLKFAADPSKVGELWTSSFGPFSRIGMIKYRIGRVVQFVLDLYASHTQGRSAAFSAAWIMGAFAISSIVVLIILFATVWVFSPKETHQHNE